jgi:hypothetical protein
MRRHHPQAGGNATGDGAAQRKDELTFAVPVIRHLALGPDDVDAYGDDRRGDIIHVEIRPWKAEGLPHACRFLAIDWRNI